MPTIHELRSARAGKLNELKGLQAKDALSDEERARFDALAAEVETLNGDIARREKLDDFERHAAAQPVHGAPEMRRAMDRYSVARAIQGQLAGRLDGVEGEMHAELSRGRECRGVMVPTEVLLHHETRNQTVGTPAAGGNLVATTLAGLVDHYRPRLMTEAMGATVLSGLSGNLEIPRSLTSTSAHWVAEDGAPDRSAMTFDKIGMGPKTAAAESRISRRLLLQSATAIEALMRNDLGFTLAATMDKAALAGTGAANQPLGILNVPGIARTTPAAYLGDTVADMAGALDVADVTGSRGFLTSPKLLTAARKMKDGDGHVIPLAELFHGERVEVSTQVPANLGAGADKTALIYGVWSELMIGYWSGIDIVLNPYHPDVASSGGVLLHAFLDVDIAVRHAEAFNIAEI